MDKLKSFIKQYFVLVILIVLIILFGCLRPESFLTMSNMFTVIRQSSIMGIATIGLLFVMVAGGIDLSLGSVISVESVLVAVLLTKFGWGLLPAYLCGLAGGTLVGLVTGAIIVKTGIFPMIGTLALQIILLHSRSAHLQNSHIFQVFSGFYTYRSHLRSLPDMSYTV